MPESPDIINLHFQKNKTFEFNYANIFSTDIMYKHKRRES